MSASFSCHNFELMMDVHIYSVLTELIVPINQFFSFEDEWQSMCAFNVFLNNVLKEGIKLICSRQYNSAT